MSGKDRICIELFHRDELSLGAANRLRYNYGIYHWAILVRPKDLRYIGRSTVYDVTDAAQPTLDRSTDLNMNRDRSFRVRPELNPFGTGHFLAAAIIGKLPKGTTEEYVRTLLSQMPLPQKDQNPEQNCISWIRDAVIALQNAGLAKDINVDEAMEKMMDEADKIMRDGPPKVLANRFINVTGRK